MKRRGSSAERNTAKSQNPKRPNDGINKKKRGQNNKFMRSDLPQFKVKQKKLKVGGRGWGCVDEDGGCHRDEGSPVRSRMKLDKRKKQQQQQQRQKVKQQEQNGGQPSERRQKSPRKSVLRTGHMSWASSASHVANFEEQQNHSRSEADRFRATAHSNFWQGNLHAQPRQLCARPLHPEHHAFGVSTENDEVYEQRLHAEAHLQLAKNREVWNQVMQPQQGEPALLGAATTPTRGRKRALQQAGVSSHSPLQAGCAPGGSEDHDARAKAMKESKKRRKAKRKLTQEFDLADINDQIVDFVLDESEEALELPDHRNKKKKLVVMLAKCYGLEPRGCGRTGITLFKTASASLPSDQEEAALARLLVMSKRTGGLLDARARASLGQANSWSSRCALSQPIHDSNKGNKMLRAMGWTGDGGLGVNGQGVVSPVTPYMQRSKQGLGHSGTGSYQKLKSASYATDVTSTATINERSPFSSAATTSTATVSAVDITAGSAPECAHSTPTPPIPALPLETTACNSSIGARLEKSKDLRNLQPLLDLQVAENEPAFSVSFWIDRG